MPIEIDDTKFQQILEVTAGSQRIGAPDIRTILQVAQLAAGIDLDDDPEERAVLRTVAARLCATVGIPVDTVPLLSPLPTDDEERAARIAQLVPQLATTGARDLAFALAYLVIVADLELAPIEGSLLHQLQRALTIPDDRARWLVEAVAEIVTPGSDEAHAVVATSC
jgi:hypothetical protein